MNTPRSDKRTASELSPLEGETTKKIKEEILSPTFNMAESDEITVDISEAPAWFKVAFEALSSQIGSMKSTCEQANNTASEALDTATQALAKTDSIETRMKKLELENGQLRYQMGLMEDKHQMVLDKLSSLETHSRYNNLVFEGIPEAPGETDEQSETKAKDIIKNSMHVEQELNFSTAHRLGPKPKDNKPRPLIVKFQNAKDRKSVWKKRFSLKHTNYIVQENYSRRTDDKRKLYYPIVKKANSMEEYKNKVFINADKLVYAGKEYSQDELDLLPEPLQPNNVFTKSDHGVYAFYGKGAKLSNFHPCSFQDDGINFTCVEQHYCFHKAKFAGSNKLARRVLLSDNPAEMKKMTNKIDGLDYEKWKEKSVPLLSRALKLKFMSSQSLYKALMSTGDMILVESNPHDDYYGAGRSMQEDELFLNPTEKGQNVMGNLLMQLRSELKRKV